MNRHTEENLTALPSKGDYRLCSPKSDRITGVLRCSFVAQALHRSSGGSAEGLVAHRQKGKQEDQASGEQEQPHVDVGAVGEEVEPAFQAEVGQWKGHDKGHAEEHDDIFREQRDNL